MSDREKFEAWLELHSEEFNQASCDGLRYVGALVWQASRRAALEEAAQVAYAHNAIMATTTAQLIENAIRALAEGDKQ